MQLNAFLFIMLLIAVSGCSTAQMPNAERSTSVSASGSVLRQGKLSLELISRAAWANKAEIFDLIAKGADPNAATDKGITALHLAVAKANHEALAALLDLGAKPNVVDDLGISPLKGAVMINDSAAAKLLIAGGADPSYAPKYFQGPLVAAINSGNFEMIDLFVGNGVDVNAGYLDEDGYIFFLILSREDDIFEHLLKIGANPDIFLDEEKELSLLLYLISQKKTNRVAIALKYGADPNIRARPSDPTPLHIAALMNDEESVVLLLQHGAELMPKDKSLLTPLDYARKKNSNEAAAVLIQAGAQ